MKWYNIIILITFLAFAVYLSSKTAVADYGNTTAPETGDWNIENDTLVSNRVITMNGNISITNDSSFTLFNVTLFFNCTEEFQYKILIYEEDSEANISFLNSDFRSKNKSLPFLIWLNSATNVTLFNSSFYYGSVVIEYSAVEIKDCFFIDSKTQSLGIRFTNDVYISGNTFTNIYNGISISSVNTNSKIVVLNNSLTNGHRGISVSNSNDFKSTIIQNNFLENFSYISLGVGCENKTIISNNTIVNSSVGCSIFVKGVGFNDDSQIAVLSNMTFIGCDTVYDSSPSGLKIGRRITAINHV